MHFGLAQVYRTALLLLTILGLAPMLPGLNIRSNFDPHFHDPETKELRASPKPVVSSRSVLLFEESTGTILFEKNVDVPIPPASLTKLVVMGLALQYLQKNQIAIDQRVQFTARAWAKNAPTRSSLMFLGPGQTCTWQDLLLGLAVDSGNDAAIAIAEQIDGTEPAFVAHMNSWTTEIGLKSTHFSDPSGYDARNSTTARDYSYYVWYYLRSFPEAVKLYHSVKEFSYPREGEGKPILQFNRNKLLFAYPGADGLKTGFIDESGYNLAFSASRNSMRLAGIILGGTSEAERFSDARKLLDYGFDEYQITELAYPAPKPIRIWNGNQSRLLLAQGVISVVLPRDAHKSVHAAIEQHHEIMGPLTTQSVVAWVNFLDPDGTVILHFPLFPTQPVESANLIVQAGEYLYLSFRELFGIQKPSTF